MHRLVEAFKFGYAQRTELGDLDYLDDSVYNRSRLFLSKDYAALLRQNISDVSPVVVVMVVVGSLISDI